MPGGLRKEILQLLCPKTLAVTKGQKKGFYSVTVFSAVQYQTDKRHEK